MKKSLLAFTLFCIVFNVTSFAQSAKGWVTIKGTVKNFNNQVEVQDMSEMSDLLLSDPSHFFVPDTAGRFSIKFQLSSPNYFRLGRNILYLSPGDNLTLFVDYKNPKLATFSGDHGKENEYLRETPFPKGGSFLEAGSKLRSTIDSTVNLVEEEAKKRSLSLTSFSGMDKEFVKLENARIKADLINSFNDIPIYYSFRYKLSKDSLEVFRKNFEKDIAPYMSKYNVSFTDPSLLKLVVYRDVVEELISKEKKSSKEIQQIKDWITARDLAQELKKASSREIKLTFETKIKLLHNELYRSALQNTLEKVLQLSNGDLAVDFSATDLNKRSAHPSDLKGKLLYIDLWATWCGPCMEEMPAFEKLKESFKNDNRIQFISLSIDDDKEAWQKNVSKRNATGYQWIIDRARLNAYNIIGIPRTILIDKDFHIVEMNALLPSSKNITDYINILLK